MQNHKLNLGIIFVVVLSLVGVFLWVLAPTTNFTFTNTLDALTLFGQLFGILGFTLFATSLILSARFYFLENLFYGLDKVYKRHSQIGQIAFMLMLFHPLLLLGNYNGFSFSGAVAFFTPSAYWPINWGIFSLGLMILLIILTLYLRPKYNIWKWTHKFMGLAFFFGAVHAFLIPSDVATYMPLRIYVFVIFTFGIGSFIYHSILGKFLEKKYKYVVSNVRVLGGNITEVLLKPVGEKLKFTPGQFAFVSFADENVSKESHPFSLSGNAVDETISFTMKNLGDYTSTLPNLKIGAKALIDGPYGKFSYKDAEFKKQIWIAGGIGVTPFLSMIKQVQNEIEYSVDVYYCVKNESEAVHLEELSMSTNNQIKLIPHYSDTDGFFNVDVLKKKSGSLVWKDIFLCAPPGMIHALRKQLLADGVPEEHIHSEEFNLKD
ncbi:MAG: ferric reductase-like transmembrane domain-containing protein [Patescibacteria group bacterium]